MPGWGGTYVLKKLVGDALALEMITTGRRLNADEALSIGLVNAVYPVEEFNEKVGEFTQSLVNGPPISLASMKKLMTYDQLDEAMEAEAELFSDLWNTSDLKEGLTAFTEKRKPKFKGK
jgi:enoyl-CoA hydratase/carnithine racemase